MPICFDLKDRCRAMVRREITRPHVRGNTEMERRAHWMALHQDPDMILAADIKLDAMTNMELLDLIGEALRNDG